MMYDDPIDPEAFFDTHGTYEWWAYIIQYKYENVVDDILTETVILFVSLSYMMTYGIRMYCFDD